MIQHFLLLLVLLVSFSCGPNPQNQIVKDIGVKAYASNDDVFLDLGAQFYLGDLTFTSLDLPIMDPNSAGKRMFGKFSMRPYLGNGSQMNQITISLNLSAIAQTSGSLKPTLPNGRDLPIGGIKDKNVFELAIPGIDSKIYLGLDKGFTFIGFAMAIKEFQAIANYLPPSGIFLGFNIKGVLGSVGVFTGDKSGIGLFADLSSVLNFELLNAILQKVPVDNKTLKELRSIRNDRDYSQVIYRIQSLDDRTRYNFGNGLNAIKRKGTKLTLE